MKGLDRLVKLFGLKRRWWESDKRLRARAKQVITRLERECQLEREQRSREQFALYDAQRKEER